MVEFFKGSSGREMFEKRRCSAASLFTWKLLLGKIRRIISGFASFNLVTTLSIRRLDYGGAQKFCRSLRSYSTLVPTFKIALGPRHYLTTKFSSGPPTFQTLPPPIAYYIKTIARQILHIKS